LEYSGIISEDQFGSTGSVVMEILNDDLISHQKPAE